MDGTNENSAVPEGKFSGFVLDPEKCRQLSLVEKRDLVHEIARWPADAPKILSSFSRRELLDIICAESGKERKFSGTTKGRMIDSLLRIVSGGTSKRPKTLDARATSPPRSQHASKRLKKSDTNVQSLATSNPLCGGTGIKKEQKFVVCGNLVCRATLRPEDGFCKRCSCCICHHYDDNKDPSLWLTCNSDPPDVGSSCGMSCHIKCALKHEQAGITKNGCSKKLDGKFSCVACHKVNDLMSTWRKQLLVIKEARRVDVLCLRILIAHKILDGSELFKTLHKPVDLAMKKLKKELGPLNRVCARMDRGIVNRLSCGAEVQKLCTTALENFSNLFNSSNNNNNVPSHSVDHAHEKSPTCKIDFEESYSDSVTIIMEYEETLFRNLLGFRLWHKESAEKAYPKSPTCVVSKDVKKYKVYDLKPSTEYTCRIIFFSMTETLGTWEAKWLTPASHKSLSETDQCQSNEIDLNTVTDQNCLQIPPISSSGMYDLTAHSGEKLHLMGHSYNYGAPPPPHHHPVDESLPFVNHLSIPSTPSKVDGKSVGGGWYMGGSGSCPPPIVSQRRSEGCDFEFCVKVVKALECDGHLSLDFRVKLLTWYSLKATKQERRVISAFVDAMVDDPPSLAGQLIHTFTEVIGGEKLNNNPKSKPCTNLWH